MLQTASGADAYRQILADYLLSHGEEPLYRVSLLSKDFVEGGLGPEDIIALHFESLDGIVRDAPIRQRPQFEAEGQQFLLEVMITYGVKFREYLELRVAQTLRDAAARAEDEHRRALDLERITHQKDELLGVIAHELRTPLQAAQGHIDLMDLLLTRGETGRLAKHVAAARRALDRLSRLSADLVEASRDTPPSLHLSEHNLVALVRQAHEWAWPMAESKRVTISLSSDDEISAICDPDAVLTIVANLLSNAIRYTDGGGSVTIRCFRDGASACVEVADTGIGMSAEVQQRIFDKFFRGPEAREREARGLGLGLALVRQMVEAHAGRIEVESQPGHGSTFRLHLPTTTGTQETHS